MKRHIPTIIIFTIIIGIIALALWFSEKDSPIKELAKLNIYSEEELSFLEKEGFLDNIDSENLPSNKEQALSLLKSPALIEQNLNSPDESFEVLATKLDKTTYQLAFKLENKSNKSKEFYLIPITKDSQTEFQEIKGVINNKNLLSIDKQDVKKEPLQSLYDIKKHKKELNPELAKAYDDIEYNNYQAKPIKITLASNSTLLAKSKWQIKGGQTSVNLEPVYLLVYGSAGGAKDDLDKVEKVKEDHFRIKYDKYSEVEIGNLETDDFEPTAKLKKWGDETYIKVSYPTNKKIKPKQEDKKLKWKDDKVEVHFYSLESREYEENGHQVRQAEAFEFEVILKEKPASNVTTLDIETKGLKFYYQPPLNQEKQEEELTCTETECKDKDGNVVVFRPENVVGSYAVYHESKAGNYEALGGKNYRAGKFGHLYYPYLIDNKGWKVRAESFNLDEKAGKLLITAPQDFIDNAIYPIRHAVGATFGFTDMGGSYESGYGKIYGGNYSTGAEGGTVNSITAGVYPDTTDRYVSFAIYEKTGPDEGSHIGDSGNCNYSSTTIHWETFSISSSPSIQASTAYWLLIWSEEAEENQLYYDLEGDGTRKELTYGAWPSSFSGGTGNTRKYSIYCTYSVAAVRIKGGLRVKGGWKVKF